MEPPEIDPETDVKWDSKTHITKTFFVFGAVLSDFGCKVSKKCNISKKISQQFERGLIKRKI